MVVQTGAQRLSEARAASSKCGPGSDFISAAVARTGPCHPRFLLPQNPGNYISQHPLHWGWGLGLTEGVGTPSPPEKTQRLSNGGR